MPNTVASIVINGSITATTHIIGISSNPGGGSIIASADVPTGTTMTAVWTTSGTNFSSNPVMAIYTVDDALLVSTTPSTASAGNTSSVTTLVSSSYTQTTGGFVVYGSGLGGGGGATWGIAGFTTDGGGGTANSQIFGHISVGSTSTGTSTCNWTTARTFDGLAIAAWR